ncbi:hypothetical protein [Polaromonas sp.]|uniref:hypothetical protein n=1 Tax=Polaromonas sp. TaxID=1869339 RepID=UPI00352A27D1
MHHKRTPSIRNYSDLITGIAPIFRLNVPKNEVHLIGTGFWITRTGHLVTAWHVVEENIDTDGVDRGPIFAVQTFPDRSAAVRNFSKSDKHPEFDLALSETVAAPPFKERPTEPLTMSLDELKADQPVFSFAMLSNVQTFENESVPGRTIFRF